MNIITGYRAEPHITAQQDRDVNIGIFGASAKILKGVGSELAATVVSANEVEIADGTFVAEGCTAEIQRGTTESMTIENGEQEMKRIDLIVARYTKDSGTGVENMQLAVVKGTPAASNPAVPSYNEGTIADGDSPVDFPIYKVNLDGISITSVDALVDTVNIPDLISDSISEALNSALRWKIFGGTPNNNYVPGQTFVTVPALAKEVYVIVYVKWTSGEKVMVDFNIPIEPFAFGSPTNFAQHVKFYGNTDGYVCIEARTTDGTNFVRLYEARNGNTDVTASAYCAYMYR
jgi:hypothetical protein